ncbi:Inositol-1,4,5-trisphosphate 5-phosphatase 1 [Smittium mucronatum]|uniref:phosphoinositide 5-phosphatase n=1 Tax=Smittium mucronatum TaxID=133383 RepID=A0A1R0H965_9FUNG|nr:Inositol-1,4,5-trisphosphate 5-phosphatase 1 [Smittium mucronatum]
MKMRRFLVFIEKTHRSIALVPIQADSSSDNIHALIIKKSPKQSKRKGFVDISYTYSFYNLSSFQYLDIDPVYGTAGFVEYGNDIFLILITGVQRIPRCDKEIYKVRQVKLISLTTAAFDFSPSDLYSDLNYTNYGFIPITPEQDSSIRLITKNFDCIHKNALSVPPDYKHPCGTLIDFLEKGTMYFSQTYQLSKTTQATQLEKNLRNSISPSQKSSTPFSNSLSRNKFEWNEFLLRVFYQFSRRLDPSTRDLFHQSSFIVCLVQGYVGCILRDLSNPSPADSSYIIQETADSNPFPKYDNPLSIMVISRLSSRRIGTRFLTRGLDDSGNVANNCQGIQIGSHKVQLSRSVDACIPAIKKHFGELISDYGRVHIINLVKSNLNGNFADIKSINMDYINIGTNMGEIELGICYEYALQKLGLEKCIGYTGYNFHEMVKGGQFGNLKSLINNLVSVIDKQKFFFKWMNGSTDEVESYQTGIMRTNCLDCLDRTNVVQSEVARYVAYLVLSEYQTDKISINSVETDTDLRRLLAESGNALSVLYTGTSALKEQVTVSGKSGIAGIFSDASKSIGRFVQGNFGDKNKQVVIDVMTGNNSKSGPTRELFFRDADYDRFKSVLDSKLKKSRLTKSLKVFVTTFNAAGLMYNGTSLDNWFGFKKYDDLDMLLISMQEVVELNVSSVISADVTNRLNWINSILNYLQQLSGEEYVLVATEQLVGICCVLLVKKNILELVKNVEMIKVKTGMVGGISGNKGAIGCRMTLGKKHNVCFVAAHLTSGSNKEADRNGDYNYITNNLQTNLSDLVIWAGDLNYRLDLPSSFDAQELINKKNYESLALFDQLSYQMNSGAIFQGGYSEMQIDFRPTYKFLKGTSDYDTRADVPRVPSYTDRILYRLGSRKMSVRQVDYYCCETFLFSDHKPVCATFQVDFDYDVFDIAFPNQSVNYELACSELHYGD